MTSSLKAVRVPNSSLFNGLVITFDLASGFSTRSMFAARRCDVAKSPPSPWSALRRVNVPFHREVRLAIGGGFWVEDKACGSCNASTLADVIRAISRRSLNPMPRHRPAERRAGQRPQATRPAQRHAGHLGRKVWSHSVLRRGTTMTKKRSAETITPTSLSVKLLFFHAS